MQKEKVNDEPEVWVVYEKPPHLQQLLNAGLRPNSNTIFAYGNTIYVPSGMSLPPDLIQHEITHCKRQLSVGVEQWWNRYLEDPYFRIAEETLAYGRQYKYVCTLVKDRNKRFSFLHRIATDLSGPIYGNVITHSGAMIRIKDASGIR